MQINGFNEGIPFFRIPAELNAALCDMSSNKNVPIQIKMHETLDRAVEYGMAIILPKSPEDDPDTKLTFRWTEFGHAIKANFITPRQRSRNRNPPMHAVSKLIDVIPDAIRADLFNDPPLRNSTPGAFFDAVGVSVLVRGERFITTFGERTLAAYQAGRLTGDEDAIHLNEFFTPPVERYVTRVLETGSRGLSVKDDRGLPRIDGRLIKPFNDENGRIILTKETPHPDYDHRTTYSHYISPDMIPFVKACVSPGAEPLSAHEVYNLLPDKDRLAFITEYKAGDQERAGVFLRLGWLARRHGGVYAFTKTGQRRVAQFRAQDAQDMENARLLRQMERDARPAYVPEELTLDDLPADDYDMFADPPMEDANDDPFDIL